MPAHPADFRTTKQHISGTARLETRTRMTRLAASPHACTRPEDDMAITQKEEARALDADERDLVQKSHHPVLQ
jgi:hypothetical protein